MAIDSIMICNNKIGRDNPVYIIAEMSANHNQDFSKAENILKAAKAAGANAVKIQTYTPDTITIKSDSEFFHIKGTLWEGSTLYDLYGDAYTPWEWHPKLSEIASDLGLDFFSSPFDATAVDYLEEMKVPAYKVASFEIVDIPLLKRIAGTGKPVIMSTGMASFKEIEEAVATLRGAGCVELALLKCTSAYPAPPEEMNLKTMSHLSESFGVPVGLSDHTIGINIPIAAVALGASVIEKHFCLSRKDGGPDSAFSLEPEEFSAMVKAVRETEKALGKVSYDLTDKQQESLVFRRSLFVVRDIAEGEEFSSDNIRSIRPGYGLHTRYLDEIIGKHASKIVLKGTPLSWDMIDEKI